MPDYSILRRMEERMENLFAPVRRSQKELSDYERQIASQTQAMQNRLFTEQLADQRAQETREYARQTQIDLETRANAEADRRRADAEQVANRARAATEAGAGRAREDAARIARDVADTKERRAKDKAIQDKKDADAKAALAAAKFAIQSGADPDHVNLLMAGVRGEVKTGDMPEPDLFGAGRSPVPAPSRAAPRAGAAGGGRDVSKSILELTKLGHDALKASVKSDRIEEEIHNLRKEIASLGGGEDIPARGKQGLPEYRDSLVKHFASQRKVVAFKDAEDSAVREKKMTAMTEGMPSWKTATIGEINGWLAAHKITEADIAAQQMERISLKHKADSLQKRGEVIVVKGPDGNPALPENWDDVPVSDIRDGVVGSFVNSHVASLKGRLDRVLDDWERIATKHDDLQGKGLTRSEILTGWANTAILPDGSPDPSNPLVSAGLSKASIEEIKRNPRSYGTSIRANQLYRGTLDTLDSAILASMEKARKEWVADKTKALEAAGENDAVYQANSALSMHRALILKEGEELSGQIQTFLKENYTEGAPGTKLPYSTWLNRGPSVEIPAPTSRSSVPAPSVTGTPSTPKPTTGEVDSTRKVEHSEIGIPARASSALSTASELMGEGEDAWTKQEDPAGWVDSNLLRHIKSAKLEMSKTGVREKSDGTLEAPYGAVKGMPAMVTGTRGIPATEYSYNPSFEKKWNRVDDKYTPAERMARIKQYRVAKKKLSELEGADEALSKAKQSSELDALVKRGLYPIPDAELRKLAEARGAAGVPKRLGLPTGPVQPPLDIPRYLQNIQTTINGIDEQLKRGGLSDSQREGLNIARDELVRKLTMSPFPNRDAPITEVPAEQLQNIQTTINHINTQLRRGGLSDSQREGLNIARDELVRKLGDAPLPAIPAPTGTEPVVPEWMTQRGLMKPPPSAPVPSVPPLVPTPDLSIPAPTPAPYNYPANVPPPAIDGITERYMRNEEYQAPPPPVPSLNYGAMIQPSLDIPNQTSPDIGTPAHQGTGIGMMPLRRSTDLGDRRLIWDAGIGKWRYRTAEDHPTAPTTAPQGLPSLPLRPGQLPPYVSPEFRTPPPLGVDPLPQSVDPLPQKRWRRPYP